MSVALEKDAPRIQDARAARVEVSAEALTVHLEDGRTVTTPLEWYPRLVFATPEERQNFRLVGRGHGVHWPALDEDLHVKGMLQGAPSGESTRSLKRWKKEMRCRREEGVSGPWASANAASYQREEA